MLSSSRLTCGDVPYVFLDTEFNISRAGPQLISIGLVKGDNEFYKQIDGRVVAARPGVRRNKFLKEHVVPQILASLTANATEMAISEEIVGWLNGLEGNAVNVAYDFNVDYLLVENLVEAAISRLNKRLVPCHVGYLLEEASGIAAAEASWSQTGERGLYRHHALADAIALQARFNAVHNI